PAFVSPSSRCNACRGTARLLPNRRAQRPAASPPPCGRPWARRSSPAPGTPSPARRAGGRCRRAGPPHLPHPPRPRRVPAKRSPIRSVGSAANRAARFSRQGDDEMSKKESVQKRLQKVRPPRVQLTYDVEKGDAIEQKEIPFV